MRSAPIIARLVFVAAGAYVLGVATLLLWLSGDWRWVEGWIFSVSMLRNPNFGRVWGISGILIAGFLFSRDVWSAPHPSDPGFSFLALIWIAAVGTQMLRRAEKVGEE
jgi:hypothetical protein